MHVHVSVPTTKHLHSCMSYTYNAIVHLGVHTLALFAFCCKFRLQKDLNKQEMPLESIPTSDSGCSVNPDVARWIEERDILLQTGVYTHNDVTIEKLDKKIKAALNC